MEVPKRRRLPHSVPLWVDPSTATYFITINCASRGCNQLALREVSDALIETIRFRQDERMWWPYVVLFMPDHLHGLFSFPPAGRTLQRVVTTWKAWTAKQLRISWQCDFFEHRLRHDESRREKATYILNNPVRKGLVGRPEEWPHVYFGDRSDG